MTTRTEFPRVHLARKGKVTNQSLDQIIERCRASGWRVQSHSKGHCELRRGGSIWYRIVGPFAKQRQFPMRLVLDEGSQVTVRASDRVGPILYLAGFNQRTFNRVLDELSEHCGVVWSKAWS